MRYLLTLALVSCAADPMPVQPITCPTQEIYQYGEGGEVVATGDWATLCRCPESRPYSRPWLIECLRCQRPDGSHLPVPGGCWEP